MSIYLTGGELGQAECSCICQHTAPDESYWRRTCLFCFGASKDHGAFGLGRLIRALSQSYQCNAANIESSPPELPFGRSLANGMESRKHICFLFRDIPQCTVRLHRSSCSNAFAATNGHSGFRQCLLSMYRLSRPMMPWGHHCRHHRASA